MSSFRFSTIGFRLQSNASSSMAACMPTSLTEKCPGALMVMVPLSPVGLMVNFPQKKNRPTPKPSSSCSITSMLCSMLISFENYNHAVVFPFRTRNLFALRVRSDERYPPTDEPDFGVWENQIVELLRTDGGWNQEYTGSTTPP